MHFCRFILEQQGEIEMKDNYLCPHCRGHLNTGDNIIFSSRTPKGGLGMILLHPALGEYSVTTHPLFDYAQGEKLQFYCPICHKELASDLHENLAKILLVDENGTEFQIIFSKVAGEKSTFKIIGDNVEVFGEHSGNYLDLIGMM